MKKNYYYRGLAEWRDEKGLLISERSGNGIYPGNKR